MIKQLRILALSLAISLLVLPQSLSAAEPNLVQINGFARVTCGDILEIGENEVQRTQLSEWINGYVSSYNYYNFPRVTPPEDSSGRAFALSYCRNNPLDRALTMGAALVEALGGKKALHKYKR